MSVVSILAGVSIGMPWQTYKGTNDGLLPSGIVAGTSMTIWDAKRFINSQPNLIGAGWDNSITAVQVTVILGLIFAVASSLGMYACAFTPDELVSPGRYRITGLLGHLTYLALGAAFVIWHITFSQIFYEHFVESTGFSTCVAGAAIALVATFTFKINYICRVRKGLKMKQEAAQRAPEYANCMAQV
jgi:hypothetical protein